MFVEIIPTVGISFSDHKTESHFCFEPHSRSLWHQEIIESLLGNQVMSLKSGFKFGQFKIWIQFFQCSCSPSSFPSRFWWAGAASGHGRGSRKYLARGHPLSSISASGGLATWSLGVGVQSCAWPHLWGSIRYLLVFCLIMTIASHQSGLSSHPLLNSDTWEIPKVLLGRWCAGVSLHPAHKGWLYESLPSRVQWHHLGSLKLALRNLYTIWKLC